MTTAASQLQDLELINVNLPPAAMDILQRLTGLTSLLLHNYDPHTIPPAYVAPFPALRKLDLHAAGSCESICALTQLRTLLLSAMRVDAADMTSLCSALPDLRSLDISSNHTAIGAGLSSLALLPMLEVVCVEGVDRVGALAKHFRAPRSLRRCVLGGVGKWLPQHKHALTRRCHASLLVEFM
jgi:hypothetical protein